MQEKGIQGDQEGSVLNIVMRYTWLNIVRKIMPNICKETGHVIALNVGKGMCYTEVGCQVKAVCTQVCGNITKTSKSCAITLLVDSPSGQPRESFPHIPNFPKDST